MNAVLERVAARYPMTRDQKIDALEAEVMKQPAEVRARFMPVIVHHFAPGLYAREMRLPKGAFISSRVHKFPGLSILSKGSMVLHLDDGTTQVVREGFHIVAPAGARRVAIALEDVVWTCMHPTDETDVDKIESIFTAATPAEYLEFTKQQEATMPTIENTPGVQP
jgi:quercetin dioxygenase-like cupin family protein